MKPKLGARAIRYASVQTEIDNLIKHKDKAIDKIGKRKYNILLRKLKDTL